MPHNNGSATGVSPFNAAILINAAGDSARSFADSLVSTIINLIAAYYATRILRTHSAAVSLVIALVALLVAIGIHTLQVAEARLGNAVGKATEGTSTTTTPSPGATALKYNQNIARNIQSFSTILVAVIITTHLDALMRASEHQHTGWFFSIPWDLIIALSILPISGMHKTPPST